MGHKVKRGVGLPRYLNVRFPEELHSRLIAEAKRQDRSVSWVIRMAVREYLEGGREER
jgi:predicted HicB family RNase H-like nuclease